MEYDYELFDEIEHLDTLDLARIAGVYAPETSSEGGYFLRRVRDAVIEEARFQIDADDWDRCAVQDYSGSMTEIVDNVVSSRSTVAVWETFTDLGAWNEDPIDHYGVEIEDMTDAARWSLFMIADRLAHALCEEIADGIIDDE